MPFDFDMLEEMMAVDQYGRSVTGMHPDVIGIGLQYLELEDKAEVSAYIEQRHGGDARWASIEARMLETSVADLADARELAVMLTDDSHMDHDAARARMLDQAAERALLAAADLPPSANPTRAADLPDATGSTEQTGPAADPDPSDEKDNAP